MKGGGLRARRQVRGCQRTFVGVRVNALCTRARKCFYVI